MISLLISKMPWASAARSLASGAACLVLLATLPASGAIAQEKTIIVGFPEDNMANDWRAAQMHQLIREFKKYPKIRFIHADAQRQVARNLQDIEDMVQMGARLLFLAPRNARLMTPVVRRLRKQGIRIVLLTRRIESEDFDTFISPNDFKIAKAAAVFLSEHLGGKGRILMLEGVPTATTAIQRSAGFKAGLKQFPGIRLAATRTGNYSRAGAIQAMEAVLRDGIRFDAIYAHNDAMAAGARLALRAAGIDPRSKPTVGIDYLPEARDAIRKGEQLASFTYPTCGVEGARAAVDILNGKKVPKYIEVPFQIVTRASVEKIVPIF